MASLWDLEHKTQKFAQLVKEMMQNLIKEFLEEKAK
jgi:hypothetical protein